MIVKCKKCCVCYSIEDDSIRRLGNGDIKWHCKVCGNETADVAV